MPRVIAPISFHPSLPDALLVPLGRGLFATVDESDECRVDSQNWQAIPCGCGHVYAACRRPKGVSGPQTIWMHRHLMGLYNSGPRIKVDHVNGDGLDNRRKNLRLATHSQNLLNRGPNRHSSSRYKGVCKLEKEDLWAVNVRVTGGTPKVDIFAGRFAVEAEAAFARNVAASLIQDPDFLTLNVIAEDEMPTPQRQAEIRDSVIAKIKAKLAGKKGTLNATSRYRGVTRQSAGTQKERGWIVWFQSKNIRIYCGVYRNEIEAAFAFNVVAEKFHYHPDKLNSGINLSLIGDGRMLEIESSVKARVDAVLAKQQAT